MADFDPADFVTAYDGSRIDVTAGRVSLIDVGAAMRVTQDPASGNVTINPDGTLAVVLADPDIRGDLSFSVVVNEGGQEREITVPLRATAGTLESGWAEGDYYMLGTDEDGDVIFEPGENHRKVYITGSNDALSLADIATREGLRVDDIDGDWLAKNLEYGGSEGMALDEEAGRLLWTTITGRFAAPGSHALLLEKDYEYDGLGRVINRGSEGESALHPLYVGSWGDGEQPIIHSRFDLFQEQSKNILVQDVLLAQGIRSLGAENILIDDVVMTRYETKVQYSTRFTLNDTQIIDTYEIGSGNASGLYVADSEGILINKVLLDLNGWTLDWEDGGDQEPTKFSHNIYIQWSNTDVTLRDSVTMRGASFGAQMRPGGIIEGNAFLDNNVALNILGGEHRNDDFVGNYTLALDNVVSSGAHKEASNIGALAWGIVNTAPDTSLVRNIIAHLVDLEDPQELAEKTDAPKQPLENQESPFVNDTIVYKWVTEALRDDRLHQSDQNVPDIPESVLDQVTLRTLVEELNGDADNVAAELADWLRENWHDGDGAATVIDFFQEGFGIDLSEPSQALDLRFVPDVRADGFRWDIRLNWLEEIVPRDGDSVDLAGNWVTYAGTTDIEALELGPGGILTVRQGRLDVAQLTSGADGELKIGLAGQFWTHGYHDADEITVTIDGGRFANTGTFNGPVDFDATGGEVLLATPGARFELDGTLRVAGDAKVGFDGQGGGTAALVLDPGADLEFGVTADMRAIGEFRSGHWGLSAPNLRSLVDLGTGGATLSLDLGSISIGASARSYGLIEVNDLYGGFSAIEVTGAQAAYATVRINFDTDVVDVLASTARSGSRPGLELIGSTSADTFVAAANASLTVRDYGADDILVLSAPLSTGDLGNLRLRNAGSDTVELLNGTSVVARILGKQIDEVRVRVDGRQATVDASGISDEGPAGPDPQPGPGNRAPVAQDRSFEGAADGLVSGQAGATDADGDPLSFSLIEGPAVGSVSLSANGSFSYDPEGGLDDVPLGETRTQTFRFGVSDGNGGSDEGVVTLVIEGLYEPEPGPGNRAPVAADRSFEGAADGLVSGQAGATDADGDPLSFSLIEGPAVGSVSLSANGSFSYDPEGGLDDVPLGETRTQTFRFGVSDGNGGSDEGVVTLVIEGRYEPDPENRAPVAQDRSFEGAADGLLAGNARATDADGDPLSFSLIEGPAVGSVSLSANGSFSYDPEGGLDDVPLGETRTQTFRFGVSDGNGGSDEGVVTLVIEGLYEPSDPAPRHSIRGTAGFDLIEGTEGADAIRAGGGGYDRMYGNGDSDAFIFGATAADGMRNSDQIFDYTPGEDLIVLEAGAQISETQQRNGALWITLEGDQDLVIVNGVTVADITLVYDDGVWLG